MARPDPERPAAAGTPVAEAGPGVVAAPFVDVPGAVPRTRGDGGMWILFAVLGFLGGQVVAIVGVTAAAALAGDSNELAKLAHLSAPPEWYIATSLVGLWLGFFGAAWAASAIRGTRHFVSDLGLRFRWVDLAGIAIGVAAQLAIDWAYRPFIKTVSRFEAPTTRLTGSSHGWGYFAVAVMVTVGAPFFEELVFRGVLFKGLVRVGCPPGPTGLPDVRRRRARLLAVVVAVVVDGLCFGLAHAEWAQLPGLAVFGMLLCVLTYRTNRLGMNMVAHASFNGLAIIVACTGILH